MKGWLFVVFLWVPVGVVLGVPFAIGVFCGMFFTRALMRGSRSPVKDTLGRVTPGRWTLPHELAVWFASMIPVEQRRGFLETVPRRWNKDRKPMERTH